jgi:hypothetical protein
MSLSRWLSRFRARLQSQKRPRRRPIHSLSGLRDWELEDRCLLSGGVPAPTPSGGWTALSKIMWNGGDPLVTTGGIKGLSAPPEKTFTFQNPTGQTIYPFLRDANTGIGAGAGGKGTPYDPQDPQNQEFRLYLGYEQGGKDYLGLPAYSSITIRVPLVFWDAENIYTATDGTNLLSTEFGYDSSSTRGISDIQNNNANTPGYWVTNFTSTTSGVTGGFIMMYHAATSLTPSLDAPAQLAEVTIRDPYLTQLGITDASQTFVLMNYDVSYVDNALAPITMEASAVQVPVATVPYGGNAYGSLGPNPPAPSYGWTGSDLTLTEMQPDVQNFYKNTNGSTAYIGDYFTTPNSPLPSTPPGWPAYYASILSGSGGGVVGTSGGGVVGTSGGSGGVKVPGGQNVFLQSPLNGTPSGLPGNHYMLTSGGLEPFKVDTGGDTVGTAKQTIIPLTLDLATQDTLVAGLQSMLNDSTVNIALSNGNNTLGKVLLYIRSGVLAGFHPSPGAGYTSNTTYKLSGNTAAGMVTGTGTAYYNTKKGTISRVGLPHYNKPGIPIFTSTPSITLTGSNHPTEASNLTPYVEGQSNGVAPTATSKGKGYAAGTYTYTIKGTTSGGVKNTATGTVKFGGASGSMQSWSFPNYKSGVPIYTSTPSVTIAGLSGGTGAQLFANIGGGAVVVTLNSGATLPAGRGNEQGWTFTRPATDYAATDITNLWYTWAQYYINQYANMQNEPVQGTLNLTGTAAQKNQAAYIAVSNDLLNKLTTKLAVGMTVTDSGVITPAAGTNVTVVSVQADPNIQNTTDFYLSQLQGGSTPVTSTFTFGKPPPLPFSSSTGIKNITVTKGGTGYVEPLTVTLQGGNGAGGTAVVTAINANGGITGIKVTTGGGNYTFKPTVVFKGGGGTTAATATANINGGQVTSIKVGTAGAGYTFGPKVQLTGGGGTDASAVAVVNPKTGAITAISLTSGGSSYTSAPGVTIMTSGKGSGAAATATVGSYVNTYANLLPAPTDPAPGGGTALQFAGSVYEALEAEASIPAAQSLRFYNAVMPPPVGLVGTTIGSDLGDLPNSNGGASALAGQVRDLIKSVLRGVWNFTAVPEYNVDGTTNWYPNPSQKVGDLPFNPFNLDPYVWFIHKVLGMSGYGFSTDDDIADVGAGRSAFATNPILPNNLVIAFGGTNKLPQTQQWFPGVPWGNVPSSGTVSSTSGGKAYVSLLPGGKNPTTSQITQYYEVLPVTSGQSGAAYVLGPGIPAGVTVATRKDETYMSFWLNVPKGETVTPSNGTVVDLTFSGKQTLPSAPAPTPTPTPSPTPPSTPAPTPPLTPTQTINDLVDLVQSEVFQTIDQVAALVQQTLSMAPTPARLAAIQADSNLIDANPLASTPLGQLVLYVTRIETLQFLLETPIPFSPDEVL